MQAIICRFKIGLKVHLCLIKDTANISEQVHTSTINDSSELITNKNTLEHYCFVNLYIGHVTRSHDFTLHGMNMRDGV